MSYRDTVESRLVQGIKVDDQTGCWLYKRRTATDEHAPMSLKFPGQPQRLVGAHRVAAWLWLGTDLFTELEICHHCDVKACINPSHLYEATHQQNILDAAARGRFTRKGERNGRAKLTEQDVLKIRRMYDNGIPRKKIARLFPMVSEIHLGYIFRGEIWTETSAMTEATLTRNMVKDIKERGGVAKKSHGGPNMAGWPDICGCYRKYTLALEVKLPGKEGTLTPLQKATLKEWKEAGAIALMVTTREQVKEILDTIDRKLDGS